MINYMKLLLALPAIASRSLPRTWFSNIFCLYGSRMRRLPIFQSTKHPGGKFFACGEEMPILHAFALRPRFYNAGPIFSSSLMVLDVFVLGIGNAPFPFFTSFVDRPLSQFPRENYNGLCMQTSQGRNLVSPDAGDMNIIRLTLYGAAISWYEQLRRVQQKIELLTCTGIK